MSECTVKLPHGAWREGVRWSDLEIRGADGSDEVYVLENVDVLLPAALANGLLRRCVITAGGQDVLGDLTLGDREALLLALRRQTFGNSIEATIDCPRSGCGARLDLSLAVSDFLLAPYAAARERYELRLPAGDRRAVVTFRVPRIADQEATLAQALGDPDAAADALLARCVERVEADGAALAVADLPAQAVDQLIETMAALDPEAELRLEVRCAACAEPFSAVLDAGAFLVRELQTRASRLLGEVHVLAREYHWSEGEILALPPRRRARYLELLGAVPAENA